MSKKKRGLSKCVIRARCSESLQRFVDKKESQAVQRQNRNGTCTCAARQEKILTLEAKLQGNLVGHEIFIAGKVHTIEEVDRSEWVLRVRGSNEPFSPMRAEILAL